jgi:hypothetical protein
MHLEERTTSLQSWEGHVYLNSELWWPKYRPCLPLFHNVDNGEICLNIHPLDVDFFSFGLQRSLQEFFCHRNFREENGSASVYHNHLLFPLKYNYNYLAMRIAQVSGQRYRRGLYLFSHYSQNQKISIIFFSESHAHIQKRGFVQDFVTPQAENWFPGKDLQLGFLPFSLFVQRKYNVFQLRQQKAINRDRKEEKHFLVGNPAIWPRHQDHTTGKKTFL